MGKVVSMEEHKKKKKKTVKKLKLPRRRRAGSFRWLFIVLLMLACLVAGYSFSHSVFFQVREIRVSGTTELTAEKVIELSGIEKGQQIFEINTSRAERMIATNYWVEQVDVKRVLPATIDITVKERVAVAAISTPACIILVDGGGYVLGVQRLLDGLPLMILSGASDVPTNVLPGEQLTSKSIAEGLSVVTQMTEESASTISELNIANTQNIIAHTVYGVDFYLGDKGSFMKKYEIAMQILQSEDEKGNLNKLKYVDVSIPSQPTLSYRSSVPDLGTEGENGDA